MSCVKFKLRDFGLAEHIVLYCVMNFFAQVKKKKQQLKITCKTTMRWSMADFQADFVVLDNPQKSFFNHSSHHFCFESSEM